MKRITKISVTVTRRRTIRMESPGAANPATAAEPDGVAVNQDFSSSSSIPAATPVNTLEAPDTDASC